MSHNSNVNQENFFGASVVLTPQKDGPVVCESGENSKKFSSRPGGMTVEITNSAGEMIAAGPFTELEVFYRPNQYSKERKLTLKEAMKFLSTEHNFNDVTGSLMEEPCQVCATGEPNACKYQGLCAAQHDIAVEMVCSKGDARLIIAGLLINNFESIQIQSPTPRGLCACAGQYERG